MKMITDNNEMNQDNEAHCQEEECCCHCRQYETHYPELPCIEIDPDNFNDWD
ncbi:hypothetical protein [Bacteroides uniformis]|uniref:hypothetical protein n=1 Tax=Bacteroides uniformis TaxID=820 RepID=UPI001897B99A|nr:hypothetical protein [Bacteroides uniformis]MDC1998211.1 hypothetical protein [Bacteroides uniformis]MDC2001975.1 hypothetical protein [Bacteroides uniformis]MDC2005702.1 hypothetical protein [Bacteroides uniformis]